jgi:glycosyltransferase involved in cell wall biosynthesis
MRILLVHHNFPGQFVHLAAGLQQRGHDVTAFASSTFFRPSPVKVVRYRLDERRFDLGTFGLAAHYADQTWRGQAVARTAAKLRSESGYVPDVIFGHSGWGETLFLREVWPEARMLVYAEFFCRVRGLDVDFDPEFQKPTLESDLWVKARQASQLVAMSEVEKVLAPTKWQASSYPDHLCSRIRVIHEGIDTDLAKPSESASVQMPGMNGPIRCGDEILTFVARTLEPYRGYHTFMRALPRVLAERKNAQVIIVGGNVGGYGIQPPPGTTWKRKFLDEVKDRIDLSRVHFVGVLPYEQFIELMRITRVHAYLTYPFVLSWSMLEAMSAGALVVASRTPPVEEVMKDGINGLLIDFFDVDTWSDVLIRALAEIDRYRDIRVGARRTIVDSYDLRTNCLPKQIEFVEKP